MISAGLERIAELGGALRAAAAAWASGDGYDEVEATRLRQDPDDLLSVNRVRRIAGPSRRVS